MTPRYSQSPSPSKVGFPITRRSMLKGMGAAGGLAAASTLLAACGGDSLEGSTVTVGSNASDEVPKNAYQSVYDAFTADSGIEVSVNTVDHNTFQEQINTYLRGAPDDIFTWFAGFRMKFFADQGLAGSITDVWDDVSGNYSAAFKGASTASDGNQYFVPFYLYPWAVFYRKSVFEENGYSIPTTLDEFKALGDQMQGDGLVPIAFADKDGWPAMGTFDYLNMRINGYDYHVDLMAGNKAWNSDEVRQVFSTWAELLPYHQEAALGRTWQDAAQSLVNREAGMYLLGMFVGQQFPDSDREDLDFFAFPEINPAHGQDSVEAPIDGFMMAASPVNEDGAKELLKYLATPAAQLQYLGADPNNVAAGKDADTSGYSGLQNKAVELISSVDNISQFLDRDTIPAFAQTVMQAALQDFIGNPTEINRITDEIEAQKGPIFDA